MRKLELWGASGMKMYGETTINKEAGSRTGEVDKNEKTVAYPTQ